MIELKEISKSYKNTLALQNLSLKFPEKKITVLIGPSGCGKSTILRLITGLIKPDTGSLSFEGLKYSSQNKISIRKQIGYVIQSGGLFPHLTVAENISIAAKEIKMPAHEIESRINELCKLTKLTQDKLSAYISELSGGQIQRVALMRALLLNPKVLLLDEPLGSLDPIARASLQTDLKEIFQKLQKTVIIVTHDMGEASYLGDTLVLLNNGQIMQSGTVKDLCDNPANDYVTEFLTSQRSLYWV